MAAHTIADFRAKLVAPASVSHAGLNGYQVWEYTLDGNAGITVAAADTVDIFAVPADAAVLLHAASVETLIPATGAATLDIQIAPGGTPADVTGFTAWTLDEVAGFKLVKVATAANFATHTAATVIRVQVNTAGLASGKWIIRMYGTLI